MRSGRFVAHHYIVTGNVEVPEGVTLTIEPGALIRFSTDPTGDGFYKLKVRGTLIAVGDSLNWITFTPLDSNPLDSKIRTTSGLLQDKHRTGFTTNEEEMKSSKLKVKPSSRITNHGSQTTNHGQPFRTSHFPCPAIGIKLSSPPPAPTHVCPGAK